MDREIAYIRSWILQAVRRFFIEKEYLETDTGSFSSSLIPETCLEVFKTTYVYPWSAQTQDVFLVPSPEVHIKPLIAAYKVPIFQISKCYRNAESIGRIHACEFTMLEYYTLQTDYMDSAVLTEKLFTYIADTLDEKLSHASFSATVPSYIRKPFVYMSMNDAFIHFAGFPLYAQDDTVVTCAYMANYAKEKGLTADETDPWDDLYELLFVHCVEPHLAQYTASSAQSAPLLLYNYPALVPCLAKNVYSKKTGSILWKERWELYAQGVELANCYSEETDPNKVKTYFEAEGKIKNQTARIKHVIDDNYWRIFSDFPPCSGVALGLDRLIMLLTGCPSLESVLY